MSEDSSFLVCEPWKHIKRRFDIDADLFEEGNIACCLATKLIPVEDQHELMESATEVPSHGIRDNCCSISGCNRTFDSLSSYEIHYNSCHRNKCHECKRNFPSNYLLDLHIQEWHDAMFDLMTAKQPMVVRALSSLNRFGQGLSCQKKQVLKALYQRKQVLKALLKKTDTQSPLPNEAGTQGPLPKEAGTQRPSSKGISPSHGIRDNCCSISGCNRTFDSLSSYEIHYNSCHRNKCHECKRNFPSNYLLDLHIQEWHDAMFDLMTAKQPMFQCLLESCGEKFFDSDKRKSHMISIHHYPSHFRFYQKKPNKANKNDTLTNRSDCNKENIDSAMEIDKEKSQSSGRIFSYKVPQNISFGHGVSRGFQRGRAGRGGRGRGKKHWHQKEQSEKTAINIETVDMSDLTNALE